MLTDINLLPQKEKKSKFVYIFIAIVTILLILIAVLFYVFIKDKNQQLVNVENQITQTNIILEAEKNKLKSYESNNSVNELENAIKWAEVQPYNMVYVLQELTKLLPERGFIVEFEMNEENNIEQIVQFDTKSEAAYYLNSLLTLEWIDEAVINEAKTTDIIKGEKEKKVKNSDILPRYLAKYELKINVELLKTSYEKKLKKEESIKSEKEDNNKEAKEEGGTSP